MQGCALLRGARISGRLETRELAAGAPWLLLSLCLWSLAELYESRAWLSAWWNELDRLGRLRWLARLLPGAVFVAGLGRLWESMSAPPEQVFETLQGAILVFVLAVVLWLLIDAVDRAIRRRVALLPIPPGWVASPPQSAPTMLVTGFSLPRLNWQPKPLGLARIVCFALSLWSSAIVWVNTANNKFALPVVGLWLMSIALWCVTLSPSVGTLFRWLRGKLTVDWRIPRRAYWWAFIAFAVILAAGLSFRITSLEETPGELINDTILNLRDAWLLGTGTDHPVYFSYNNGRALSTFYITAALAAAPGFDFDQYTLKMSTALSGFAALPFMLWLGIEFCGRRRKQGVVLGLLLAALVAVSFWDVVSVRAGASYALVSCFAALAGIFVIRAIRHNQRADYIMAGLALGFSIYTYQAARVFPVAVAAAVVIALALNKWNWRERLACAGNSLVMACVAFVVFLPMFHYMVEYPDNFWKRATQTVRAASSQPEESDAAARETTSILLGNIREHILMYHWRGGNGFLRGVPGGPLLDTYSGALFLLGLAAMSARMLRRRDPLVWMLPAIIFLMNLPGILVLAPVAQISVPNNARVLGALPFVYLVAAFALLIILRQLLRAFPKPVALLIGVLLSGALLLASWQQNHSLYFGEYHEYHRSRTPPGTDGGKIVRGYLDSGGVEGNVFLYATPELGEPRYIAEAFGSLDFPNLIWMDDDIRAAIGRAWNRETYTLDANRELFFLYRPKRLEFTDQLRGIFPEGYMSTVPTYKPDFQYAVYRVPALGRSRLMDALGIGA